jgi:cytochrome c-type biogenesis protein CcmH
VSRRLVTSWVALALVLAVALVIGTTGHTGPRTSQDRVYAIADTIKCPKCEGETVAESDVDISRKIRTRIAQGVDQGKSDDEIRADIANSYGEEVLLTPSSSGVTGLIWILPVVVTIVAFALLGYALWRWRRHTLTPPSDEDRELVEAARRGES